jgi:hypothetical protein
MPDPERRGRTPVGSYAMVLGTRSAVRILGAMRVGVGIVLLLCIRGVLLWIVWPVAGAIWLVRLPAGIVRRRRVRLWQIAGWLDANLIAALERTLLRPLVDERSAFASWREVGNITERPTLRDLM